MLSSTPADASARRRATRSGGSAIDFIGTKTSGSGPHAFLVECAPAFVITPHFHVVEQYQVAVGGGGRLGKQALAPGVLQYADAYTPYGPIVAGDTGLAFFTLRRAVDPQGAHRMPGSKSAKARPSGRNLVAAAEPGRSRTEAIRRLIEQPDGVAAFEVAAAPSRLVPDLAGHTGTGSAFLLVLAGTLTVMTVSYPERSCLFFAASEGVPAMRAGRTGAVALLLRFADVQARR